LGRHARGSMPASPTERQLLSTRSACGRPSLPSGLIGPAARVVASHASPGRAYAQGLQQQPSLSGVAPRASCFRCFCFLVFTQRSISSPKRSLLCCGFPAAAKQLAADQLHRSSRIFLTAERDSLLCFAEHVGEPRAMPVLASLLLLAPFSCACFVAMERGRG